MNGIQSTRVTAAHRLIHRWRRTPHVLSWLLIASLVLSSLTPAFAEDRNSDGSENPIAQTAPSSETTDNAGETKAAIKFIENQDAIIAQVFDLVEKLEVKTVEMRKELGDEIYETTVKAGKSKDVLGVQIAGVGKAEPTTIKPNPKDKNGVIITRVVHEPTGIAFLVIDSRISLDSPHLRQYIARQHLDANNYKGRPVLVIQIESQTLAEPGAPSVRDQNKDYEVTYRPKPTTLSAKWQEWRDATLVAPTKWDFAFSQFCAAGQVGITCGMADLQQRLDPSHAKPYLNTALLSYAFATAVGTYSSTWRNWTNRGTPLRQTLKASTLSVAFAYGLHLMDHGMVGMKSLFLLDPNGMLTKTAVLAGLALQFNLMSNVVINNMTKNYWSEFSRIRENMGVNRGPLVIKVPFTGIAWETPLNRTSVESQMINFGPYTLKLAALTGFYLSLPVLGHIDAGKLAFWSSMVWVQYLAVKYAQMRKYEKYPMLKARWDGFPPVKYTKLSLQAARSLGEAIAEKVRLGATYCQSLLTEKNPKPKPTDTDTNTDKPEDQ